MNRLKILYAATLVAILVNPAIARQSGAMRSPTMPMASGASGSISASSRAFKTANDKMMEDMNHPMTGSPDQDFVAGMLPHHAGAVAMANVELKYGRDPRMLRLAREVVVNQEAEIVQMQEWQSRQRDH